jgi:aminoglycoside phosphotransferase (APT) family kinase protein
LAESARETLAVAERARDDRGQRWWPRVGDLRRVVAALPHLRSCLLSAGQTVIHGDMHPGNVILRGPADTDVVLLDWARARVGSPLEDVASWLHSLGCWEPEARRRHDTLMRTYLQACHTQLAFAPDVRTLYWFASVSNGLAGAIRYHLSVLSGGRSPATRADSSRALRAWTRVVSGAARLLRPSRDRRT